MLNIRCWNPWMGLLAVASLGLMGCSSKTAVSTTGNAPAVYSHVFLSVQEVWFNNSATATPDDTTWVKFVLPTPVTVDLATSMAGTVTSLTQQLALPAGLYQQIRLIPVDSSTTLLTSAQTAGAIYNSEVDYTDSNGNPRQLPMELLNPDKGIGVAASIQIRGGSVSELSSTSTSTSTDTSTNSTSGTSTPAPVVLAVNIDGARDLVPFTYDTAVVQPAVLLNPHMTGYNVAAAGAIQGTVDISGLTDTSNVDSTGNTNFLNIQVTAETLSTDGSRHTVVNSTAVKTDGTFTLYPLSTDSSSPTSYDLVIHGPGIATIVVKSVAVAAGDPTTTTPVNIGTVAARTASPYAVTLATTTTSTTTANNSTTNPLPAGAMVDFYQTIPAGNEVPYVVEQKTIDPFTRAFATNFTVDVSSATIDYGTYSSGTVPLNTATPAEGASTYRVAATAPLYTDGALTTLINASNRSNVVLPTLVSASGVFSTGTVIQISRSTNYDHGDLIISRDGAVVGSASLDTVLAQSSTGSIEFDTLPAGTDSSVYYVSVRVWDSSNPAGTLKREIYPAALDLRSGIASSYSINID